MKPMNPAGDFARTVNWAHFWHCMKKPHHNPQLLPNMRPPLGADKGRTAADKGQQPAIIALEGQPGAGMQRVVIIRKAANA